MLEIYLIFNKKPNINLQYLPTSTVQHKMKDDLSNFALVQNDDSDSDLNAPSTSISPAIYPFSCLSLSI